MHSSISFLPWQFSSVVVGASEVLVLSTGVVVVDFQVDDVVSKVLVVVRSVVEVVEYKVVVTSHVPQNTGQ